jgi:hypothetical protein
LEGFAWQHGSAPEIAVGQTFRLTDQAVLRKLTVKILPQTDIRNEVVSLWLAEFSAADDYTVDSIMKVYVGWLPPNLAVDTPVFLTFHLSPYLLEADRQYGFLLRFEGGGNVNNNRALVLHTGDDVWQGGLAYCYTQSDYLAFTEDLIFYLQGSTERPPNDDCESAMALPSELFIAEVTDVNVLMATTEPLEPQESCIETGLGTSNSVWFEAVPSYCGTLELTTVESAFDSVLSVYGGSCDSALEIACDDDGGGGVDAYLGDVPFRADDRLLIKVADYGSEPQIEGGDLKLIVRGRPVTFDYNLDCTLSLQDHQVFSGCIKGPNVDVPVDVLTGCWLGDSDEDSDVDLNDIALFQQRFGTSPIE